MFAFNIYNTDNTDPDLATGLTRWGPDPISGEYDPRFEWEGRGSHVITLGGPPGVAKGRKHQDSGLFIQDRKIRIAGSDMFEVLRSELQTKYEALDTEYHFTDGLGEVFKVRWSRRPRGFNAILNTPLYATGIMTGFPPSEKYRRFTYEVMLWIISQEV
jgi:hypothetical protein